MMHSERWIRGLLLSLLVAVHLVLIYYVLKTVSRVVWIAVAGALLAFIFEPFAGRVRRVVKSRGLAAILVMIILVVGVAVVGGWLAVQVAEQARHLAEQWPSWSHRIQAQVPIWQQRLNGYGLRINLGDASTAYLNEFGTFWSKVALSSLGVALSVVSVLADIVLSVVVAFYLLLDGPRLWQAFVASLPPAWQPVIVVAHGDLTTVLGKYIRGQILVSLVFGSVVAVGMLVIGLPYPLLLGLQAGIFEFLPTVGPVLGAVAPVLLSLALPWPAPLVVVVFFFLVQQLEGNLLVPRISGHAVGLHPLAVIIAILLGFELGGLVGAMAAVPVVGVLRAWFLRFVRPLYGPAVAEK